MKRIYNTMYTERLYNYDEKWRNKRVWNNCSYALCGLVFDEMIVGGALVFEFYPGSERESPVTAKTSLQ